MRIESLRARAFTVPTESPESDGTLEWSKTTLVLVEVHAGGQTGVGYTYADTSTAKLVNDTLLEVVKGGDPNAPQAITASMVQRLRNLGTRGVGAMAISAIDSALWDLKARLLGISLATLLGPLRERVPVYGSGGFTSYDEKTLGKQLAGWTDQGIRAVKMKIGREPSADLHRVRAARKAIGDDVALFVDANGAYSRKQALDFALRFAEFGVRWFEEPVSSDDLEGLHQLVERAPGGMDISAGEYGYVLPYFRRMLEAHAVDVLQFDVTRALGITGALKVAALAESFGVPLSTHCAPAVTLAVACATPALEHVEWFFDHVRIEQMLFDGAPRVRDGFIAPDFSAPGNGLAFKEREAARWVA